MSRPTFARTDFTGRRVLLRADLNAEAGADHEVESHRLVESLPTLRALRESGARIVLATHLGRPAGIADARWSTHRLASQLSGLLGCAVQPTPHLVGWQAEAAAATLEPGGILLLENLRFHPGEEANTPEFAGQLARLGDLFVNDAFGTIHRDHASISGVPAYLPAVAGLLVEREVARISEVLDGSASPLGLVLGGVKMQDKLGLLERLLPLARVVCIGGAMATAILEHRAGVTSLYARGNAAVEEGLRRACELLTSAEQRGAITLVLPTDVIATRTIGGQRAMTSATPGNVPAGWMVRDIGYRTVQNFSEALRGMNTVIWNGPMGMFEDPSFAAGTVGLASALARLDARVLAGGGDTATAVRLAGVEDQLWHLSTGGGATLAMLGGERLPGLEALGWAAAGPSRVAQPTEARRGLRRVSFR